MLVHAFVPLVSAGMVIPPTPADAGSIVASTGTSAADADPENIMKENAAAVANVDGLFIASAPLGTMIIRFAPRNDNDRRQCTQRAGLLRG